MRQTAPGQNYFTTTTADNSGNGTDENGQSLAAQAMRRNSRRIAILKEIETALTTNYDALYPLLTAALAKVKS